MIQDDTALTLMGPHALARIESRVLALRSFGIDPQALVKIEEHRSIAKQSREKRELTLRGEHTLITTGN